MGASGNLYMCVCVREKKCVSGRELQYVAVCCNMCSVLKSVEVCSSVLQCVIVCCSVLQ